MLAAALESGRGRNSIQGDGDNVVAESSTPQSEKLILILSRDIIINNLQQLEVGHAFEDRLVH